MRKKLRRALLAGLDLLWKREVIGQEECPLMLRWTLADLGGLKLLVHHFPPEISDRDPHDHPRPFVTFVLRGRYRDESWHQLSGELEEKHGLRLGEGIVPPEGIRRVEHVRAGAVKYRAAEHMHIVETDEVGCWTLVVMGPLKREWGFMRLESGSWWPWGKYVERFGGVIRCEAEPDRMGVTETESG